LRSAHGDRRYRLLLLQYRHSGGVVTSCKQMNNWQVDDLLAICEALGWRCPGRAENHFRKKVAEDQELASFAQRSLIKHLRDDLGWNNKQLGGMIKRITKDRTDTVTELRPIDAYKLIEALKSMFCRKYGLAISSATEIKKHVEAARDGKEST